MNNIDKLFCESQKVITDPAYIIFSLLENYLEKEKIWLSKFQLYLAKRKYRKTGKIEVKLFWINLRNCPMKKYDIHKYFDGFNNYLNNEVPRYTTTLIDKLPDIINSVTDKTADQILSSLDKTSSKMIIDRKNIGKKVKKEIQNIYGEELKNLKMILELCKELSISNSDEKEMQVTYSKKALRSILQTSCLVLSEIYCLIENGYADGAIARWRTIHEFAVVAEIIADSEEEVAEMFIEHSVVSDYKEMIGYEEHKYQLGLEELSRQEKDIIENKYKTVVKKYGEAYVSDYGWFCKKLQKNKITFYDIEKKANLDYLKPYYKLSCNKIHAGSKSLLFKLGNLLSECDKPLMYESFIGIIDPIQLSVLSIVFTANSYLAKDPTPSNVVYMKIISLISTRIMDGLTNKGYIEIDNKGNIILQG